MIRFFLCCIIATGSYVAQAQIAKTALANDYSRINSYSTRFHDGLMAWGNPAALSRPSKFSAGFFAERRFFLEELSVYDLAFLLPSSSGNFTIKAGRAGGKDHGQTQLTLAYARTIGTGAAGARFSYWSSAFAGYGQAGCISAEVGFLIHLFQQFQIGGHVYYPKETGSSRENALPFSFTWSVGGGYDVSSRFFMGMEAEKVTNQSIRIAAGIQYAFEEKLMARVGLSTSNHSFYVGTGIQMNSFRLDLTAAIHQSLGVTPGTMFIYQPVQK